jgi:hypothetical protein
MIEEADRVAVRWQLRIPEKATTLSGAWRPRDPVDDDQSGARARWRPLDLFSDLSI